MVVIDANNNIYDRYLAICCAIHAQNMCNNDKYMIQKNYVVCCKTYCKTLQYCAFLSCFTCFYMGYKAIGNDGYIKS